MHLASIFLMVAPPNMQSAGQIKGSQGARVRTGWSSKILSIKNCKTQNTKRGEVATKTDAEGYVTSYEYNGNGNCVKMTTVDGDTLYEYDPLDRLIKTTTPDGESTSMTYDGVGNITSSTDANGNTTQYIYDGVGNVVETIDALGTSAFFEYDEMGRLTATKLHRVDTQDNVDEW